MVMLKADPSIFFRFYWISIKRPYLVMLTTERKLNQTNHLHIYCTVLWTLFSQRRTHPQDRTAKHSRLKRHFHPPPLTQPRWRDKQCNDSGSRRELYATVEKQSCCLFQLACWNVIIKIKFPLLLNRNNCWKLQTVCCMHDMLSLATFVTLTRGS